ncbi:hypothetical protein EDB84DRAFT_1561475 [Lactarius hengduanensis]|nr:hypothetical protein EDB84DRAFT_1561475 [Lactarius hengduanensis]
MSSPLRRHKSRARWPSPPPFFVGNSISDLVQALLVAHAFADPVLLLPIPGFLADPPPAGCRVSGRTYRDPSVGGIPPREALGEDEVHK